METEPAVSDWIKREDEAEAAKARARLAQRVSCVRDQPTLNLTQASAYGQTLCLLPPPISPVPQAGHNTLAHARALAPTRLDPLGPQWDPWDSMDCSEDDQRGADGTVDPPSSPPNMLFTQHSEEAVQEPHDERVAAADLLATQMLIGDHAKPLGTHHLCLRA